jgi:Domain of unknown function DUF29
LKKNIVLLANRIQGNTMTTLTHETPDEALEIALTALDNGDAATVRAAVEYAINDIFMGYKYALRSQLIRLMMHVIKWKIQPEHRSHSWVVSIINARDEIAYIQSEKPSLNRRAVESLWDACFATALRQAEGETNVTPPTGLSLAWHDVFDAEYFLPRQ